MAEQMQAKQDCDCAIRAEYGSIMEGSKDVLTFKGITYCPMHKAAPEMLQALEGIQGTTQEINTEELAALAIAQARREG